MLYTDFVSTEEIVSVMLEQKEIRKALTRSNLYKFWAKTVGEKFAEKSKPYSMLGGGVMVIACENAIVAQELMLKKTQLLLKLQPYMKSLKMNVKELKFVDNAAGILVKRVKPDFKKLGPRYGKIMKQLAAIIATMSQEDILEFEKNGSFTFDVEGTAATVEAADVEILSEDIPGWLVANEGRLTVALDITVTDELRREGYARELINRIQNIRKSNGYEITDKIHVTLAHNEETDAAVAEYCDYMSRQVLAESFTVSDLQAGEDVTELDFDTFKVNVKVVKA